MIETRWYLKRHEAPRLAYLVVEESGSAARGIMMPVVSRAEAKEALPYLRGELQRRIASAVISPTHLYDPVEP